VRVSFPEVFFELLESSVKDERTGAAHHYTGFMGAAKTTVAAALARKLSCAMLDLDDLIKERSGRTPQEDN